MNIFAIIASDRTVGRRYMKYRKKEIEIFESVLALLSEGKSMVELSTREIAEKANMGKATLYEYFKSKEELIGSAMVYAMDSLSEMTSIYTAYEDPKKGLYEYYKRLYEEFSLFLMALARLREEHTTKYSEKLDYCFDCIRTMDVRLLGYLRSKGAISSRDDQYMLYILESLPYRLLKKTMEHSGNFELDFEMFYTALLKCGN